MKATYGFRATMTARPGKGDELVGLLLSATTDGSGASEHCVVYLVGRSASNREVVHVTEGWTTREAHAENFATEQAKAFVARIAPLLADEPRFRRSLKSPYESALQSEPGGRPAVVRNSR